MSKNIKIGAHLSIAGGKEKAVERITEIGGNCLQIFSGSPRTWAQPKTNKKEIDKFLETKKNLGVDPVYFHASYLLNFGDTGRIAAISKKTLINELKVAAKLNIKGSIVHPGSFKDKSDTPAYEHKNYDKFIDNIKEVLKETPKNTFFIVENSGTNKIAKTIEEIEMIIKGVNSKRMKVCLDTCHLHAAGYDLSSKKKLEDFLKNFDEKIGLDRLELWHVNDSRDELGSFRDRHDNLKEGHISPKTFDLLINHPKLKNMPFVIETPGFDGKGPDKKNVDILKKYIK